MKTIKVTFNTLTPLWTGDAWRECRELKLTGIIGSLRWWFEALVRGMGYNACDSTGNKKCKAEIKKIDDILEIHKNICPVCFLFGTTGWKSRFSVKIIDSSSIHSIEPIEIRTRTKNRRNSRYLSRYCKGLYGKFNLEFSFDSYLSDDFIALFVKLLQFLSEWGMIGASISQGNGVCEISFEDDIKNYVENDFTDIVLTKTNKQKNCNHCPNFQNFRFLKARILFNQKIDNILLSNIWRKDSGDSKSLGSIHDTWRDYSFLPIGFHIRDLLRGIWRSDNTLRHKLMGEMRKASNILVSHGYKISDSEIEFRIVGINIGNKEWENLKSNLTVNNAEEFMFSTGQNYIKEIKFAEESTGNAILNGGTSS